VHKLSTFAIDKGVKVIEMSKDILVELPTLTLRRGLNPRQQKFCTLVASGLSNAQAYQQAGYRCKKRESLDSAAYTLAHKPHIKEYLSQLKARVFVANAMTSAERRDFLARVKRTPLSEVTADSDLAQEVEYGMDFDDDDKPHQYVKKIKVPNKLAAVELDAKLAGELQPDTHVNVGIQLVNDRIKRIESNYIPEEVV
jgi:hypothetical protein